MRLINNPIADMFVDLDQVAVTDRPVWLTTSALASCSALVLRGGGKHMLAHVTDESDTDILKKIIQDNFDVADQGLKAHLVPAAFVRYNQNDPPRSNGTVGMLVRLLDDLGVRGRTKVERNPSQTMFVNVSPDEVAVSHQQRGHAVADRLPGATLLPVAAALPNKARSFWASMLP